jgi:hypothetical protein
VSSLTAAAASTAKSNDRTDGTDRTARDVARIRSTFAFELNKPLVKKRNARSASFSPANGKSPCANLSEKGRRPSAMQAFNPFPSRLVRFSAHNRQTPFETGRYLHCRLEHRPELRPADFDDVLRRSTISCSVAAFSACHDGADPISPYNSRWPGHRDQSCGVPQICRASVSRLLRA